MVGENLGELYSIYVLPEHWGSGQGCALFRAAAERLKEQGYSGMYLWVLRDNLHARMFYERMGMTPSEEERELEIAGAYLHEIPYRMQL